MARLRSDSPLTRRVVHSFLRFLSTVELAPNVDPEAVLVASQCLADAFGLEISELDDSIPDLALLFQAHGFDPSSQNQTAIKATQPSQTDAEITAGPSSHIATDSTNGTFQNAEECTIIKNSTSESGDLDTRLFEQYKEGLESAGYLDGLHSGIAEHQYQERISKAREIFSQTFKRMKTSSVSEQQILAESFKAQGNDSMANSQYIEAIDLYTMAISLCGDNAVYYSNRAAAHTQVGKYDEAIADSNKAIQLDPNYSKAYSRLGLVYYTQGKYKEAIEKGFERAHALDPSSKSIEENLRAAQQKLTEERTRNMQQSTEQDQQQQTHSNNQTSESRFNTTIPLNVNLPAGMANLFPAMANLAAQFTGEQGTPASGSAHGTDSNNQPSPEPNQQQQTHSTNQTSGQGFSTTFPLNVPLPPGMENLFPGIANLASQFTGEQAASREGNIHGSNFDAGQAPEVRMDGSVNVTVEGDQLPPQFAGLMQSMLQMFAGASGQARTQESQERNSSHDNNQ